MNENTEMNTTEYSQPTTPQKTPNFVLFLTLSIVQLVCCSPITGVIALVFTCVGDSAYKAGNNEDSESKMKVAKISIIVGFVLAGVFALVCSMFRGFALINL